MCISRQKFSQQNVLGHLESEGSFPEQAKLHISSSTSLYYSPLFVVYLPRCCPKSKFASRGK